ncbi:TetR/AcrR family transcriptional regulator [Paraferrimonas haliotis]|nr:TetR/AcrR family transcriptional regulator [Paraferrimonas haliotis]
MKCPTEPLEIIRCNQILDAAENLIDTQGIISFKFSQLAQDVGSSTGTIYKWFKNKEDVLVCLFLRSSIASHLPRFIQQHKSLS